MQKLTGGVRVANVCLLVDSEDERKVERVGAVGEGFFELAVDAEPFECSGEVAGGPGGGKPCCGPLAVQGMLVQMPATERRLGLMIIYRGV